VAGALAARGLGVGDRVALILPTSGAMLSAVLGALRSGVVPVVLNPALLPDERQALVDDADPSLVVDSADGLAELLDGAERDLAPYPLARPMHYTSGTSGRPKGVWSGILSNDDARRLYEDEREVWHFAADDVHLVSSPLFHSAAIRFSAGTLLAGGRVVLLNKFEAGLALDTMAEHQPTTAFMAPAHLQRLHATNDVPDVSSFRLLAHAGAPCPEPLKRWALDVFPDGSVWEFYGSTEGQFTVCSPDEWLEHPGTVGRARFRRTLSLDADGTIWCTVPAFARFEYWRDPEKTAAAWRGDAFTVGDLGRLDADGYLYLEGRRDDLIISGGVNVYPAEVEGVLAAVPGIGDVAVFGAPDDRWGQRVCAVITDDAEPAQVLEHARRHLAAYKCPKDVYRLEELPKTATGKVRRSAVAGVLGLERPA
jgi:long-chain acyl-CoA synthetase